MKSILSVVAASVLLGAVHAAEPVSQGCFSSHTGLTLTNVEKFQTDGFCQGKCAPSNAAVIAIGNGTDCYCGSVLPPAGTLVDSSNCNIPCPGYGTHTCGAVNYFSVWLSGISSSASNSDAAETAPVGSSTTSAKPSVITVGGQTVVVTASGNAAAGSGGGVNKAGIAAGVIVGIVALCAIGGGIFLFIRNKRRREVEAEYRRNAAVSSFIAGGKPGGSAGSFSDTRLDPTAMAARRMSSGSIADNQDYSRRILKVTNA